MQPVCRLSLALRGVFKLPLLESLIQQAFRACRPLHIGVAYSGGRDSTALLHLTQHLLTTSNSLFSPTSSFGTPQLSALHIHHGLSKHADEWLEHVQLFCQALGIPLFSRRIQVLHEGGQSLEEQARKRRYTAFAELCQEQKIDLLLLAHHQDDQLETFWLKLLRGTGSLQGMPTIRAISNGNQAKPFSVQYIARPWLDRPRREIEQYLCTQQLIYIEDESNDDLVIRRNALRLEIIPLLDRYFPSWRKALLRFDALQQQKPEENAALQQFALMSIAKSCQDLAFLNEGGLSHAPPPLSNSLALPLSVLRSVPAVLLPVFLRHWLSFHGVGMPTAARLQEIQRQITHEPQPQTMSLHHESVSLHLKKGFLYLSPRRH